MRGDGGGSCFFCGARFCQLAEMAQSGESRKRWDGHLPSEMERHGEPALEGGSTEHDCSLRSGHSSLVALQRAQQIADLLTEALARCSIAA